MGKKLLVISQYFYPEQFRINDLCTELVKRGYEVTVLTGIPNYPQGEYYDGYSKKEKRKENWNGVRIIRLPIEPRKTGAVGLIRNYFSFVRQGRKWIKRTQIKADVVFTYEVSPMTQALVGVWYAKKNKIPHILYVMDLWPENVEIITGIHNRFFLGIIQKMVDYIYRNSVKILTSSKSFIKAIEKRRIANDKIEFWPQYAEDYYKVTESRTGGLIPQDGRFNLVFAGNMGYAQGLGVLVDVAARLKQEHVNVCFNIIGEGRYLPELNRRIDEAGVRSYFNMIGRKPPEEIPGFLAAADGLLITLSKSEVFSITIPAKTQSYLACARPILVCADGEVQNIITEAGAGFASPAEDVEGLFANIKALMNCSTTEREKMALNALSYSRKHFDKTKLMDRIDVIMAGVQENVKL